MTVLRGKLGSTTTQSVWSLVVGDVILLESGSKIPADCLVLESDDLEVDEDTKRNDYNRNIKKKGPYVQPDRNQGRSQFVENDPFLFNECLITRGKCKALVLVVGEASSRDPEAVKL